MSVHLAVTTDGTHIIELDQTPFIAVHSIGIQTGQASNKITITLSQTDAKELRRLLDARKETEP